MYLICMQVNSFKSVIGAQIEYVGFHMTSQKFKLKNYRSYRDFTVHGALEQLKTNFHTNFRFKRVLGFVIEYA